MILSIADDFKGHIIVYNFYIKLFHRRSLHKTLIFFEKNRKGGLIFKIVKSTATQ